MGRRWLALVGAALLVAPAAPSGQEASGRIDLPERLCLPGSCVERAGLSALIFRGDGPPRFLTSELRISGIDGKDVQRTIQAYNRRSEVAQISRGHLIVAPYLLQKALDLDPDTLLQVRLTNRTARLVFQVTWR